MKSLSCLNNTSVLIVVQIYYYATIDSTFHKFYSVFKKGLIFFIKFVGIISLINE